MFGTKKNAGAKQAPISSHPFFAAVVALWFAALLGLGSLVLPVALFEKFTTSTGISSIVTAAQPPLGTTARIAIAVFLAIAGAVAGLFIARKVAKAQSETDTGRSIVEHGSRTSHADESVKKPISAHDELGADGFDEPVAAAANDGATYSGKRRSLAVTDDSGPSDYLEAAPLPGGPANIDALQDTQMDELELPAEAELGAPLELADAIEEDPLSGLANGEMPAEPTTQPESDPVAFTADPEPAVVHTAEAPIANDPYEGEDPVAPSPEEFGTMTDQANPPIPAAYNPLGNQEQAVEETLEATVFAAPKAFESEAEASTEEVAAQVEPPRAVVGRALNELGMVELVERFALALQSKADADAAAKARAEETAAREQNEASQPLVFRRSTADSPVAPFAPSEPDEAGAAVAEFFATPSAQTNSAPETVATPVAAAVASASPAVQDQTAPPPSTPTPMVPAALQPLGLDDSEDEEEEGLSLSLSLRTAHQPISASPGTPPAPAVPAAFTPPDVQSEDLEDDDEGADYSSLLAMRSPLGSNQEFVRIEEGDDTEANVEAAVIFPGSEQRRAVPASDGPTRDPILEDPAEDAAPAAPRPFDAPGARPANGPAIATSNANPGDTEKALREALEKLQRMSGAA